MPSTVIREIAYRPDLRELEVLFTTGRRYLFHDVPVEAADAFRRARIKGRHFNARIRGRYAFEEVTEQAGGDARRLEAARTTTHRSP
jgi:lysyl-tRNA synthetase class 2